jgi:SAM-dependent methyltransferase
MAPTLDWREYYEHEVALRRFVPAEEPFEEDRVRFVFRLLGGLRPARVLDVGCGDGYLCKRYVKDLAVRRVDGVDISTGRLRFASRLCPTAGFVNGRVDRLPFRDDSFPLVSAVEVIEHLEDPTGALREIARVSSGHVVATVPNEQLPAEALCPNCLHRFPVDGHLQMFTMSRLVETCRKAGLEVVDAQYYFVPAAWERRSLFRLLGDRGRAFLRRLLVAAGLLGVPRAKYIGVLCRKAQA